MLLGIRGCGGRLLNDTYSFLQLYTWLIKSSQNCICFGSHSDVTLTPHDGRWRYILNQWLRILRKASHWKLIQNSAPYTMVWRQCDINVFSIVAFKRKKFELYYLIGANLLLAKHENFWKFKIKAGFFRWIDCSFCWDRGEKQTYGWVAKYSRVKEFFFGFCRKIREE